MITDDNVKNGEMDKMGKKVKVFVGEIVYTFSSPIKGKTISYIKRRDALVEITR